MRTANKKPPAQRAQEVFCNWIAADPSELISQAHLDYPGRVDDAMTTAAWNSKRRAGDVAVYVAERMPIERIRNIQLEYENVRFKQGRSFDDRKVLIDITGITDAAQR